MIQKRNVRKTPPASSSGVEEGVDDIEEEDQEANECEQGIRVQSIPGREIG